MICVLAIASGRAQSPSASQPIFRATVAYIEVDVSVTDRSGRFVSDLSKDEFQVSEDGKPQAIAALTLVQAATTAGQPTIGGGLSAVASPFISNERPFEGRIYAFVLDDLHTNERWAWTVRAAARQFIQRHLAPRDLMAVVGVSGTQVATRVLTADKAKLMASIERFTGRKLPSATIEQSDRVMRTRELGIGTSTADPYDRERGFNARAALDTLRSTAEWLSTIHGRRKSIVFLSEGIDYDLSAMDVQDSAKAAEAQAIDDASREAIAAANRGNVTIYSVDPRGLSQFADESLLIQTPADVWYRDSGIGNASFRRELAMSQRSLRELSDDTGGFAALNANSYMSTYERIVADNSAYYLLAYQAPSTERDGKRHRIGVRVTRPGLSVRARGGYMAPRGRARRHTASAVKGSEQLLEALATPLALTGLPLRVALARFQTSGGSISTLVAVEIDGQALSLRPGSEIELAYVAIDDTGRVRGSSDLVALSLEKDHRARAQTLGVRIMNRLELPVGTHQLRVVARDVDRNVAGSVVTDLEIRNFAAEPLAVSDVVVTSARSSEAVTLRGDALLQPLLPAAPVSTRAFAQWDVMTAFAEIYAPAAAPSHSVDIETSVIREDGTRVMRTRDTREIGGGKRALGYSVQLPLQDFAPGHYVMVVEAASRLGAKATRQLHFTVTATR